MMLTPQRKAKIIWNCRRGMLELDLMLARVLRNIDTFTAPQLLAFESMLTCTDPEIYAWLMGYESPADKELIDIVCLIKSLCNP